MLAAGCWASYILLNRLLGARLPGLEAPAAATTVSALVYLPVAAVLGSKDLMSQLAPLGPVYQAGTMAGNPVCLAAGVATLTELAEGGVYKHIEMLGKHLDAAYAGHELRSAGGRWCCRQRRVVDSV